MDRKGFYTVDKISDRAYRITSKEGVFCELILGDERAMLIDTTYGLGDLQYTVRQITDKPLIIACTHGHVDHTSGNCQFCEPVYLAKEDIELCKRHNARKQREFTIRDMSNKLDYMTGKCSNILPEDFDSEEYLSQNEGELLELEEHRIFDLGEVTIETIKTPGHTKGGMSFYYRQEKWLYAGDAFNPFLWLFDQDATDRKTYVQGLDKVMKLPLNRIYGGHNPFPMTMDDLKLFKRAAEQASYEKGFPFKAPILDADGNLPEIRVCIADGMTMEDIGKPGFASIVIDESR